MSKHHNHAPGANEEKSYTPPKGFKEKEVNAGAIVPKANNAVAMNNQASGEVLRSDIIVPYLVVQQGLSDFVAQRKAQMGDICKSTDPTKMGDPEHPIEVVFLHCPKAEYALEQKMAGSEKYKFRKSVPRNAINENIEWKYWSDDQGLIDVQPGSPGSSEWRRVKRLSAFALVVGDIEAEKIERAKLDAGDLPDPSKALTPVIISFRVMSYNAGKEIVTFYQQAKSMGVDIFRYKIPMNVIHEQNDKGQFYVWQPDRTKAKGMSKEDMVVVNSWAQIVNSGKGIKVDESDETEAVPF